MKARLSSAAAGVEGALDAFVPCVRYEPARGFTWNFNPEDDEGTDSEEDSGKKLKDTEDERGETGKKRTATRTRKNADSRRFRRVLDHRRLGERTEEEEEMLRSSEAIDRILVRISKSDVVRRKV